MFGFLFANAFAAPCDLQWVPVQDLEVGLVIENKLIPTHSVVKALGTECAEGHHFELMWAPSFSKALSQVQYDLGDTLCLKDQIVPLPSGLVVYAHEPLPAWAMQAGDLSPFDSAKLCGLEPSQAPLFSILPSAGAEAVQALQAHWQSLLGEAVKGRVEYNPWGYVALPHEQILTADEIKAADALEHLDTDKRREKGIRAIGPAQAWLHFWGADQPYSDHWAPPDRIREWVELAVSWNQSCLEQKLGSPTQCALKIGDIAWLNPKLPDPLGHKTHYQGACMDIRLFRNDDSTYEAYWNRADDRPQAVGGYSQTLTQAFVDYVHSNASVDVFYFNDPNVKGVQVSRGHDDHLHLCLK